MWFFDKCNCCLKEGELKEMWAEYMHEGQTEIYGDMLAACFALSWDERSEYMEQICESCVQRLRHATEFRREVVAARELLDEWAEENKAETKPLEDSEEDTRESTDVIKKEDTQDMGDSQEGSDEEVEYLSCNQDNSQDDMHIEYLEDEFDDDSKSEEKAPVKRKWPKKKKKEDRLKSYKQYSREDLETALQQVLSEKMTRSEAAAKYGVPVKTLGAKIRAKEMEDLNQEFPDDESKTRQLKFLEEIRTILTYTNATPYKNNIHSYYCAYCTDSTDSNIFSDPNELRIHTRTKHLNDRLKGVEIFMRPYYANEILKLDIYNLTCTVCSCGIDDWNSMFDHLRDIHDITLDLAYNHVIPFNLQEDVFCVLCNEKFHHYHMLDAHMNAHYNNYICGECGDTFLTKLRLNKHMETHSTKQFPCNECGKIFALDKYRKKHIEGVHMKERKFKCHYCVEKFPGEYTRHLHELKKHNEKVKVIPCEYCEMTFRWRPYYLKHIKLCHTKPDKKFKCKFCDKKFRQKHELRNHLDWHQGNGFTCDICDRKFSSKSYLNKHRSQHEDQPTSILIVDKEGNCSTHVVKVEHFVT